MTGLDWQDERTCDASEEGDPNPPVDTLDRFELGSLLGEGGMGQVWDAWDPRLQRRVAVKRLLVTDAMARQRFLREARLQAGVSHPGICPVFEVGQVDGMPFIVMHRLEGKTLDVAVEGMALEQKLVLVRQVAEAVHAAHRQGLIHRDLKPSNILVERPEEGPPRPVVLDFGIARPLGGDGLTAAGQLVGTPAYMAPEQVEGDAQQLDRRTDVYGLGATLYRLLAGRTPHQGTGATLLVQILRDEPARLAPLGIPIDVEAIAFKCMEKERENRYESALALADDLGRYLDGQPVKARRVGRMVRGVKWLRRNRAAVRVGAVAAVLLVVALAWGLWTSWQAEERQRLARQFGAQIEEAEALVRYSQLTPLHDVRPDRVELRSRLEGLRGQLDGADATVQALAHHALGRGHLALDELETAQHHLEAAWALDEGNPELAADLGRVLSELYRDRLTGLERVGDQAGSDDLRAQLRQRLGKTFGAAGEMEKQLRRSLGEPARDLLAQGHSTERSEARQLEALAAFHDGRPADAIHLLGDDAVHASWQYEPLRLEGDIRRSWAVGLAAEGGDSTEEARRQLEGAREAYAQALEVAESHAALFRDDAQAVYLMVRLELVEPAEVTSLLAEGLASLEKALMVDSDDPRTWLETARLHRLGAEYGLEEGLDAAVEAAEQALARDEGSSVAWYELGRAYWRQARRALDLGEDASVLLEQAGEAYGRVLPEDREYAYFTSLGLLRLAVAMDKAERGLDATAEYRAAILAYREAAERHSAPFAALSNLGVSLYTASALEGIRPREMLERAIETFERARDVDPEHMVPHYYLGFCRRRLAQGGQQASVRLDNSLAEAAVADFERAIELAPEQFPPWVALGETFHLQALDAHDRGQNPAPFFDRARQAHGRALELAPEQPVALLNLAWTAYFEGKFVLRAGGDASSLLSEAEGLCRQSLSHRRRPAALLCLGSVRRLQAEQSVRDQAVDRVGPHFGEARDLFEEILTLDPGHAEAHRSLGRLFTLEARWLRARRESPVPALDRARRFLDEALELEGELADFWLADARWHLEWIASKEGTDEGREGSLLAIRQSLAQAAEWAPDSIEVAWLENRLKEINRVR